MKHSTPSRVSWHALLAAIGLTTATLSGPAAAHDHQPSRRVNNVVLVHGSLVDGSGWEAVYKQLTSKGYNVSVVQNPTTSLAADVAATKAVLDEQNGPVVLVGHSYGGAVVTEAGNDAKVTALVYVAAFVPDAGESVQTLTANPPPGTNVPPFLPPVNGFLTLDKTKFPASFAADLPLRRATFLANAQVRWGLEAFAGQVTLPAWRARPNWYLLTTEDRMIPPPAQRAMSQRIDATVYETRSSHAVYESNPKAVVDIIEKAAYGKQR